MNRFLIQMSVVSAEGSQVFYVDANSEEEALQKHENGESDLYSSDVNVTRLAYPEICGTTDVDDFGDFSN